MKNSTPLFDLLKLLSRSAVRRQRKQELKTHSFKQAKDKTKIIYKTRLELTEAQKEYLLGLGEAVNE